MLTLLIMALLIIGWSLVMTAPIVATFLAPVDDEAWRVELARSRFQRRALAGGR